MSENNARTDGGAEVSVAARLEERPANPAMTPDGRLLVSHHPFPYHEEATYRVVECLDDGGVRPFPNEEWSTAPDSEGIGLHEVIGMRSDANGVVYIMDMGDIEAGDLPKIVAWDTRRDELHRVIDIPYHATRPNSLQQDIALDQVHNAIFIADMTRADMFGPSDPAIVAVDLDTGRAWRALQNHESLQPEDITMSIDGEPITSETPDGTVEKPKLGLNPITIDPAYEWVYYGAIHGTSVYRIRVTDLLDTTLSAEQRHERIERYGEKAISDGISIDTAGNVYVTDLQNDAVGITDPSGEYRILASDSDHLRWPDGFCCGPDGKIYVTATQLHHSAMFNGGVEASAPPFEVLELDTIAPSTVGR